MIGIVTSWMVSLLVALVPLMEEKDHIYYNTAILKNNAYFKHWDVDFETLRSFVIKLFTFHPDLRNATENEQLEVINTKSWAFMENILQKELPFPFQIDGYYG